MLERTGTTHMYGDESVLISLCLYSCLEAHYPHFPMMDEISQTVLSSVEIGDTNNTLYILSKFVLEYPRLHAAGALLPDLLEFYQWIHTELAYLVTRKYAESESIGAVIKTAEKKYAGIDLNKLYERVKGTILINDLLY